MGSEKSEAKKKPLKRRLQLVRAEEDLVRRQYQVWIVCSRGGSETFRLFIQASLVPFPLLGDSFVLWKTSLSTVRCCCCCCFDFARYRVLEVKRRRSGVSYKALFQSSFYWLAAFFPHFLPACSLSCRSVVCHFAQRRYKPALLPFLSALRSSLSFALHFPLPVPEPFYPRVTHYRPHRITLNKKKGFGITAFLLFAFLQRRRLADLSPVLV